jgi:hypothetical protein
MGHIGNNIKKAMLMEKVVEKLDNINKTLEGIRQILSTPENKVMTIFQYVGAGVSALGLLSIAEIIRQWVMGG